MRTTGNGDQDSCVVSASIDINSGDKVRVVYNRSGGTNTIASLANSCRIKISKVNR